MPNSKASLKTALLLVKNVEQQPIIWDKYNPCYNDEKKTEQAWIAVSARLRFKKEFCRNKWNRLHASFIRYTTDDGKVKLKRARFNKQLYENMEFILRMMNRKKGAKDESNKENDINMANEEDKENEMPKVAELMETPNNGKESKEDKLLESIESDEENDVNMENEENKENEMPKVAELMEKPNNGKEESKEDELLEPIESDEENDINMVNEEDKENNLPKVAELMEKPNNGKESNEDELLEPINAEEKPQQMMHAPTCQGIHNILEISNIKSTGNKWLNLVLAKGSCKIPINTKSSNQGSQIVINTAERDRLNNKGEEDSKRKNKEKIIAPLKSELPNKNESLPLGIHPSEVIWNAPLQQFVENCSMVSDGINNAFTTSMELCGLVVDSSYMELLELPTHEEEIAYTQNEIDESNSYFR